MSIILDVCHAFPGHFYSQEDLLQALKSKWKNKIFNFERLETFHKHMNIKGRHIARPLEWYQGQKGLKDRNDIWIEESLKLSTLMLTELIEKNAVPLQDVGLLMSTTVTGLAIPSLEARLMNKIPFSPHTKRLPLMGLGCLAGVAGINRVHDYLKAYPKQLAILVAVELCSLTFQEEDLSIPNLVSTGLFGDGAACVLMAGDEHPLGKQRKGYEVLSTLSTFYPQTEQIMGWDIVNEGFKIVLSNEVPKLVKEKLPTELNKIPLELLPIEFAVAHPGGPKVLSAMEEVLELPLHHSHQTLADYGNMSSVSVLLTLERFFQNELNKTGENRKGMMLALGPAFCSEFNIIQERG